MQSSESYLRERFETTSQPLFEKPECLMLCHPFYPCVKKGWYPVPGFPNYEVSEDSIRNKLTYRVLKINNSMQVQIKRGLYILFRYLLIRSIYPVELFYTGDPKSLSVERLYHEAGDYIQNLHYVDKSKPPQKLFWICYPPSTKYLWEIPARENKRDRHTSRVIYLSDSEDEPAVASTGVPVGSCPRLLKKQKAK